MRSGSTAGIFFLLLTIVSTSCGATADEDQVSRTTNQVAQPQQPESKRQGLLRRWRKETSSHLAVADDDASALVVGHRSVRRGRARTGQTNDAATLTEALNCTYRPPRLRRYRPIWRRRQRKWTRRAYRMAVLAKLAYWDFRGEGGEEEESIVGNSTAYTCFALADDPSPPRHIVPKDFIYWGTSGKDQSRLKRTHRLLVGIATRSRMQFCRIRHDLVRMIRMIRMLMLRRNQPAEAKTSTNTTSPDTPKAKCQRSLLDRHEAGRRYQIEWTLQNWHEASLPKIRWHDTDLILATSGSSELVLSFAGTASAADQFTNVQTFEPVSHSGIFGGGGGVGGINGTNSTISGSIHRGFLNAYSRVVRGTILRLCDASPLLQGTKRSRHGCKTVLTSSLHHRYDECIAQQRHMHDDKKTRKNRSDVDDDKQSNNNTMSTKWGRQFFRRKLANKQRKPNEKKKRKRRKLAGCQSHGEKLMDILREVTTDALQSGYTVHLGGHSLGGGISTVLALDIIINMPTVPISRLHLWTFGAPEVADSTFFETARQASTRLDAFLRDRKRYHRFVTRAQNCATDFITSIASKGLNRRTARRLGGVRGNVAHAVAPAYIPLMAAQSGVEGHYMQNYLKGISIESPDYPLSTDFPSLMSKWLGEVTI